MSCKKTVSLPYENAVVRVLSKYGLKDAAVIVPEGRVFLSEKTIVLKNNRIKIKAAGEVLVVSDPGDNKKFYNEKFISISLKDYSTVEYMRKGRLLKRSYVGTLEISIDEGSLCFVNHIPVEEYVHAAALWELGDLLSENGNWKKELISAMEISIRSYLFRNKDRHKGKDYAFCDLTHCVYFAGIRLKNRTSLTPGIVMIDADNSFHDSFFHSTCGGILTGPRVFWKHHPSSERYRRGKDCGLFSGRQHCAASPHFNWQTGVSLDNLKQILKTEKFHSLKARYTDKRVSALEYQDRFNRPRSIPVSVFMSRAGRLLGWNTIKSNLFSLRDIGGGYLFSGRGLGHGIGLCQWGAQGMALEGKSYKEILRFYYNDVDIVVGK
ncbi:MAG: SpoIID/LytB domain-containing protein [bacterium]|nr:SpoIID/LytB domain-containing protein [bacterium]